jgi:cystathionine beta-lyase/cystathionine gamma-synthase
VQRAWIVEKGATMTTNEARPRLETHLLHPHYDPEHAAPPGPVAPALIRSSTYRVDAAAEEALASGKDADRFDIYARYGTPTTREAALLIARLEDAPAGLLLASGTAATATTMGELVPAGGSIAAASELYGGTEVLLREELEPRGIQCVRFDATKPETLERVLERRPRPDLVWCESISNPLLRVAPLSELGRLCGRAGVPLVVDNTFAAGIAVRPLQVGATLVMHSVTKYINGHSDVVAGAVCGGEALVRRLWSAMTRMGGCIDPTAAWLVARGVRTLPLRWERQCTTAGRLAAALARHSAVRRMHYPGLESHPSHAVAKRELRSYGGMLAFELASAEHAARFLDRVRLCIHAPSLGGVETLVCSPARTSHARLPPAEREALGITDGTIRVSVGLEDADDLWLDMQQALESS